MQPSPLTQAINVALELSADNDTLRGQNQSLQRIANLSDEQRFRFEGWLLQTLEAYDDLSDDLDDARAEWAHEWTRVSDTMRTFSDAAHSAITASGIALNVNQGLLARIDEQAETIARLEADLEGRLHLVEHSRLEVLEERRMRVEACARIMDLEKSTTPFSVELERKIAEANKSVAHWAERFEDERRQKVAAFERNAELEKEAKAAAAELKRLAKQIGDPFAGELMLVALTLDGPRAPSVPRRETPGMEVLT